MAVTGDLTAAEEHLAIAVATEPGSPGPWRDLARVREASGQLGRALEALRRASALLPQDEELASEVRRLEDAAAKATQQPGGE